MANTAKTDTHTRKLFNFHYSHLKATVAVFGTFKP